MKRCVDGAGSYGVESNMFFRVFHGQSSSGGIQTTFSDHRKGSGYASNRIVDQRCSDAHDAAAALLCLHLFNRKLRDVNETPEVDRNQRVKVICCVLGERLHQENAGVRDDGIDRAELLDREFRNFLRGFKLTYITIDQGQMIGS